MSLESIPLSHLRWVADSGLLVLIWLVQSVIYPSFLHCRADQLVSWHATYTGRITWVVVPLMLLQAMVIGVQIGRALLNGSNPHWTLIASAVLVVICWLSTFSLSVPLHGLIAAGDGCPEVLNRLVLTNWPRTLAWTGVFMLTWISPTLD